MAKDRFHDVVKTALVKDGWKVTHDPFELKVGGIEMEIDLGAERLLGAEMQKRWIHQSPIHCAIRDQKVWLLANSTEHDVGADLVERGIPREDIVIGFFPRYMREYSDYAVG
ncbi:MAG: element excision factor XisI family protein [Phormidesmis sp.]